MTLDQLYAAGRTLETLGQATLVACFAAPLILLFVGEQGGRAKRAVQTGLILVLLLFGFAVARLFVEAKVTHIHSTVLQSRHPK